MSVRALAINEDGGYLYKAFVKKVVDGDTIDVIIDLGFKTTVEIRCRLNGIDAPEIRGAQKEAGKKLFPVEDTFF